MISSIGCRVCLSDFLLIYLYVFVNIFVTCTLTLKIVPLLSPKAAPFKFDCEGHHLHHFSFNTSIHWRHAQLYTSCFLSCCCWHANLNMAPINIKTVHFSGKNLVLNQMRMLGFIFYILLYFSCNEILVSKRIKI